MDNKPHILQYALNKFALEYSGFEQKIQTYLEQKQMNEVVRSTHSLKGVAAHLHAAKLLQAVLHLESLLSVPSFEGELTSILEQVQQEIDHISESLPW